jgi:hypothetical protein
MPALMSSVEHARGAGFPDRGAPGRYRGGLLLFFPACGSSDPAPAWTRAGRRWVPLPPGPYHGFLDTGSPEPTPEDEGSAVVDTATSGVPRDGC